ncbi:site-specific integrase [Actinosynnema sp. NPDC050436]|uniref:tyrosine-type recombinase/integrase n=1 Tax=Actinosynnema sp. NPDC050436 TaxID=3155659 RepID=UPI0033E140B4
MHLLAAMRAVYTHAVNDQLLPVGHNPAARVPKPRRRPTSRHALSVPEVTALNTAVALGGRDAPLDSLLIRLHLETACRRGGALALREEDVDTTWCLLRLREKDATIRWQPASPTLVAALLAHRAHRGTGTPSPAPLLRTTGGTPITSRHHDHLWVRLGRQLPWITARNISTHWQRHTTLTWVERHFGHSVAHAYAGHTSHHDDVTTVYTRAVGPAPRESSPTCPAAGHERAAGPAVHPTAPRAATARPARATAHGTARTHRAGIFPRGHCGDRPLRKDPRPVD